MAVLLCQENMIITKKIWPEYFEDVASGKKKFELRLADFKARVGDTLILKEWDPQTQTYTGRSLNTHITYVLKTKNLPFWSKQDIDNHGFQILQIEPLAHSA